MGRARPSGAFWAAAGCFCALNVYACVDNKPDELTGAEDAGARDTAPADMVTAADSSDPIHADSASVDANVRFDAGPPRWQAPSAADAGPVTTVATGGNLRCSFVVTSTSFGLPPLYTVSLTKTDAAGRACDEAKGTFVLTATYSTPQAIILVEPAREWLAVAYTTKATQSGTAKIVLSLEQLDWLTGNLLHMGLMKTKLEQGAPMTVTQSPTGLYFADGTGMAKGQVLLKGAGPFPGASGSGSNFVATYDGFLSDIAQPSSAADTAVLSDGGSP
jgi:hypothetical protein